MTKRKGKRSGRARGQVEGRVPGRGATAQLSGAAFQAWTSPRTTASRAGCRRCSTRSSPSLSSAGSSFKPDAAGAGHAGARLHRARVLRGSRALGRLPALESRTCWEASPSWRRFPVATRSTQLRSCSFSWRPYRALGWKPRAARLRGRHLHARLDPATRRVAGFPLWLRASVGCSRPSW